MALRSIWTEESVRTRTLVRIPEGSIPHSLTFLLSRHSKKKPRAERLTAVHRALRSMIVLDALMGGPAERFFVR